MLFALLVGGPTLLFLNAKPNPGRIVALAIVASRVIVVCLSAALQASEGDDRAHWDVHGRLIHFRSGRPRELEAAIVAGDTAKVSALANRVNLNKPGQKGATFLTVSVRELWRTTNQLEVLTLLERLKMNVRQRWGSPHSAWRAARLSVQLPGC